MNLCNNARDAMPDGGRLTIAARQEGRQVLVAVSDEGCGMDRETATKCFDPFYTTKSMEKGTGLGLSTTFGIIKSHEGLITVDSKLNRGTTFTLRFPCAPLVEQVKQERETEIIRGNGELILVVDDESEITNAMIGLLKLIGYRAEFASNGTEGLKKYLCERPDAVLMDINMPEMDGVACIEEILNYDRDANISVFSGYNQDIIDNLSPAAKKAVKGFVPKPVGLEELSTLLAKMIKK
jgi:CheY-like chemotaxis protein